jgi:hypothetical protein
MTRSARYPIAFAAIALGCALVAGSQLLGQSRDYENYLFFFNYLIDNRDGLDLSYRFEPGFSFLVYLLGWVTSNSEWMYGLIVWAIVFLKYLSIPSARGYWFAISVFTFYFISRYFVLFELTVLRAACAFALAFFVFMRRETEKVEPIAVMLLLLGVTFHYSAIIFLFIYFARGLTRLRVVLLALICFSVVTVSKEYVLALLPQFLDVFGTYEGVRGATLLPIPYLLDLIYFLSMLCFWRDSDVAMRYGTLGVAIGAALHFSLVDNSLLASRFRELLSMFLLVHVVRASISKSSLIRYTALMYAVATGFLNIYVEFVYDPLLS